MDVFLIALMTMAYGHVTQLQKKLSNLGSNYSNGANKDQQFYTELIDCCKRYESYLR